MAIFRRRPLFLCCSVFMLACLAGFFLGATEILMPLGIALAVGTAALLLWRAKRRDLTGACVIAAAILLLFAGLFRSHLWFYDGEAARLSDLEGQTVNITGTVTDRRGSGSYMTSYAVRLATVNGEDAEGLALLTCHYVSDLQSGYEIDADVTAVSLDEAAGEGYDATVLWGDGYITGLLSEYEASVTVTDEHTGDLSVKIGSLRRSLAATLNRLTPDAKGLPSALLLGDRTALSDSLRRDFARAGVSHLLAISGLHVTLLFGLLEGLLRLLHVPKRGRVLLLLLTSSGYLLLLGFPPSATRAVIMLGSVYISYLLSARADPLTSLGLAGALILAVTPCAVADGGFWMSYLATLGLLTVLPVVNRRLTVKEDHPSLLSRLRIALCRLVAGLLVGVVAMSFTLPVMAAAIGEMGILSPLSTLILTPFCGALLVLSLLSLPFGGGSVGALLGGCTEAVCQVMEQIAAWIGSPSWTVISLRHQYILPIAIGMLAAMLILLAVRLSDRRKWMVALPLLVGWTAIGGVLGVHSFATAGDMTVTYIQPSSASDMLVLTEGNQSVICDLSNGSLTAMNAATREAERSGATEIAVLMLTHFHSRTAGTLSALLSRETVRSLWLPVPDTEDEYYLLLSYLEKAEAAGVPVHLYDEGEVLSLFGGCAIALDTDTIGRSVQPVLLLSFETEENRLVYCGSAVFESDLARRASLLVSEADTVIFGNHGPLVKKPFGDDLTLRPSATVILSEEGEVAGWFVPDAITEQPLWLGEWSGKMEIGK
ncbi:MAG: ComEC/Rec2 family competence protein [Clostridia bacterium]|nr:ComEC/Rec2 family competence protein [Clostridia bacterium]